MTKVEAPIPEPPPTTDEPNASLDPQSVVIIHPGSQFLRIGRASDVNPKKILHAIARRRKSEKFKHSPIEILEKRVRFYISAFFCPIYRIE